MTQYWFAGSTEEFVPPELLDQARLADEAGFDGLALSDHFAPWFPDGEGSQAWVTLSAIGAATRHKPLATGVTPIVHHYHPALVAQAFMSLEALYPGRVTLGVGSGESVNESPLGLDWPSVDEQQARLAAGLEAITRLWDGETVTMANDWFSLKDAKLWTIRGRPKLVVSAFGPKAARIAGQYGDGLWTLGDPESAPEVIEAYRDACQEFDRTPGAIIVQSGIAWAADRAAAIEGARRWKPTQLPELYTDDISDQADMQRRADEQLSDEEFATKGFIISDDAEEHVERIREMEQLGADVVSLQLIGQADPHGTLRFYGDTVLPALRGDRALV